MKTNAHKSSAALAARPSARLAVTARPHAVSGPRLARPGPAKTQKSAAAGPVATAASGARSKPSTSPARVNPARLGPVRQVRVEGSSRKELAATKPGVTGVPFTTPTVAPRAAAEARPAASAAGPTHGGRGDATLARYMSELAHHDLLGRDEEIALAQEVERLEVAYWRTLLGFPRAAAALCAVIAPKLEEPPTELAGLVRVAPAARSATATRTARTRYERAVERLAIRLRELDVHRDAVKQAHQTAVFFADSDHAGRGARAGKRSKVVDSYIHDIEDARRAQQAAKDRFVAANLRLVVSMARRYAREGRMPLADLIQEGNLGLIKAVERFDHRRGFRFSTYASWWIRHALTRGLADKGRLVRLPVHALETRARLTRAARKIMCKTGEAPSLAELAAETGLPHEKLVAAEELSTEAPFSLDVGVGADNDRTFLDMLRYEDQPTAEDSIVSENHKTSLTNLMNDLSPFEAQILRYRYGFDGTEERTLKEIGQMYNLSRERIRQIQACALAKMRTRAEGADAERAAL